MKEREKRETPADKPKAEAAKPKKPVRKVRIGKGSCGICN